MKILLISPLPPPVGGIATWTVKYKQYCDENAIPLTVVNNALQGSRGLQINAKRRLSDEMVRSCRILGDLLNEIRKERPDVIHLNSSCSRFGIYRDCLCTMIGKLFAIPVVVQCHCNIEDQIHGRLAAHAFRWMVSMCSKVLVLNRFSAEYAKGYAAEKVEIIPNFIDESALCVRNAVSRTIRRAVFVGHVRREKGVIEIIRAAEKFPDIRFILAGPVQQEIADMKCSNNVELIGAQSREKVQELLKAADVFLFPSYTEGFANALLEAMAAGLPVIATDVGANAEMIEDKGGIIIPTRDSEAIVGAFRRLQEDSERRLVMGTWNTQKVRDEYLLDVVIKRLMDVYSSFF